MKKRNVENPKEKIDEYKKEYSVLMKNGDIKGLKHLRSLCIQMFLFDDINDNLKEQVLNIAFDCHRMCNYINITGAREFLSIKEHSELENPIYELGLEEDYNEADDY